QAAAGGRRRAKPFQNPSPGSLQRTHPGLPGSPSSRSVAGCAVCGSLIGRATEGRPGNGTWARSPDDTSLARPFSRGFTVGFLFSSPSKGRRTGFYSLARKARERWPKAGVRPEEGSQRGEPNLTRLLARGDTAPNPAIGKGLAAWEHRRSGS